MPIVRRERNEDLAIRMHGNVGEEKNALAFPSAALAKRDQAAQTAISFSIRWEAEKAWGIFKIEPCADDETQARLFSCNMRADDASKRIAVGNGDSLKAERLRLRYEFFAVRGSPQKREVGRNLELCVIHANNPCRNQRGGSSLSSSAPP
jgi:hypothetical protein